MNLKTPKMSALKTGLNLSFLLSIVMLMILSVPLRAQIVINEICPSNSSLISNFDGDHDDWIEIYNAGASNVNLAGYGLSDDASTPYRFTFPSVNLDAGQRLLIFASDTNITTLVDHYEAAVKASNTWKYWVGNSAPDTNWRNLGFNDASWSSGQGGIGFGDGDDATVIPQTISVMMRRSFTVPDTSQIVKAIFFMDYDDGFVAYLNGVEIARSNLGTKGDRPAHNVLARSSREARMFQGMLPDSFYIDPVLFKSIIRQGTNVLAVQTHNESASSADLSSLPYLTFGMRSPGMTFNTPSSWFRAPAKEYYNAKFKLSRTGETVYLTNASGITIDQKAYASMDLNHSFGRTPDGGSTWCYFNTPTPNASNATSVCFQAYASQPVFSVNAGFYPGTMWLTLSTTVPGGIIRYTINGDEPTPSSPSYSSPILISNTVTVRARVFANGYLPSTIITNTYFINENLRLPVFTITTDSLNLWDWNTGIYALGPNAQPNFPYKGANFWQGWRKPAAIEYYDRDKNRILRFNAEIGIYGNYSMGHPQKSFEISLSDRFGTGEINYALMPDKPYVNKTDNIVLRNSGTDWNVTHFRDALMQRIMKPSFCGYLGTDPVNLFLNGKYWGVYTVHENHDQHWMKNNFGLSRSEIDYLKEAGSTVEVKAGSDTSFWTMYNYATTQNPNGAQYYNEMNRMLDIPAYTDYFVAETYYNNGDWIGPWTNNIKMWRPNAAGGKWRYLLYDLDFGMNYAGSVNDNRIQIARNPQAFSHSSEMFDAILKNPTYKSYFINRYADMINTIFLPSNVDAILHSFQDSMAPDMPRHFATWGSNMSNWQTNINRVTSFATARPAIVRNQIQSEFGMTGQVTLTLNVSPAGAGRIQISTITPGSYPWSGVYFNGNPVNITAIPNPGFSFSHWSSPVVIGPSNTNQSLTRNFTSTDQITAHFTGSAVAPLITFTEINYNSSASLNPGDWVELHNYGSTSIDLSGWKFRDEEDNHTYNIPLGTVIPAGGYLVLAEDSVKFRSIFPTVSNVRGPFGFNLSNGGEEIRLFDHNDNLYLSVYYQDVIPWPVDADGLGYTLERNNTSNDPNNGSSWFTGCIGGSPGRAYGNILGTNIPVSGSTTFCTGSSSVLTTRREPGYTYQWLFNGNNIPGATDTFYVASTSGQYSVRVSYFSCANTSDQVTLTQVAQAPAPTASGTYRCGPGTMTISATATDSIYWYDAPAGNLLGSGPSFITPHLTSNTTYYVSASRTCPSNPVSVNVEVLPIASEPVISDTSICGPNAVTLTASDTATIYWYTAATGGALVETGSSFTTPHLNYDTVYYLEAGSLCPSNRVSVYIEVLKSPAPVTVDAARCGDGSVTLNASASDPITWFSSPTGGTPVGSGNTYVTPILNATTNYYAQANGGCPSVRVPALAIIDPVPPAPSAGNAVACLNTSVTLTATSTSQVYWFDAPSGGNLLHTGSTFTTPNINSPVTYYVEAGFDCRSARTSVNVSVSNPPQITSVTDGTRCGPGTVTLSANSSDPITWYGQSSGGSSLGSGSTFVTPHITATTIFYAQATSNCAGPRVAVTATVTAQPDPPVVSDGYNCGNGSVTLSASSPAPVSWYDQPTGGNLLHSGYTFTTPVLNATTTYYAIAGVSCLSNAEPAIASIYPAAQINLGNDTVITSGNTLVLDAGPGFISYAWSTGASTRSITVNSSNTYSVLVLDSNNCAAYDEIEVTVITDINQISKEENRLFAYPNPAGERIMTLFSATHTGIAAIRLIDMQGRILQQKEEKIIRGSNLFELDLSDIIPGAYIIEYATEQGAQRVPIIRR
ncbi:MAG: T9SS C-terminal target domain-containing protein [Bacteroidetes bacterium]|nr:MAG: T9SS C-terminal target domain-containing protein [Bacteroidota bacterium]REK05815.1 MAG: T9SS C-terminal target domain-containing protein [Bacteroidota bacterium]REK31881.1 MAG: T9SS C-terminal target domain-containing protein [Bacteroidota bacterium]REK49946.1 MAG: T9SS C-terminal target domain-containing protein [Bacteroidota bacterium]